MPMPMLIGINVHAVDKAYSHALPFRQFHRRVRLHLHITRHAVTNSCTALARGSLSPSILHASCARR
jgi:hypothetical protein